MKREDIFYKAMQRRDPRFDGKFFVGVKTTGIFCRPICPARPKRENVEFFKTAEQAQLAGYRACLRCRPEVAQDSSAWMGKSAVVKRAVRLLQENHKAAFNEDTFAELLGVSARHLRRLFNDELGKTAKQVFFDQRLNHALSLIQHTEKPISEIAFAAGFQSIRRFNDSFKARFKQAPQKIRKIKGAKMKSESFQYIFQSEIGPLHFVASEKGLQGIFWKKQLAPLVKSSSEHPVLKQAVKEVQEYLSGKRKKFEVSLDIQGTEFQMRVWKQLQQIPYGKTVSYSDIAKGIKNEKAVRAVGTANGRNPLSLIVPCHRVIAADGTLGGYAGGLSIKTKLLKIEQGD